MNCFKTFHISVHKMIFGQKIFFWASRRRWKLEIFLNFNESLWRHDAFMKYTFIFDINFIWKSFRSTTNFSKWMTQFVWISSAISNFSYSKPNSRGPNSKNRRFCDIFSVTDIYRISKIENLLRTSLSKLPDSYRKCLLRWSIHSMYCNCLGHTLKRGAPI